MSFIVVSPGHSGSKFLATQLNKVPGWTVEHEPNDYVWPEMVNKRFDNPFYGEVNPWLLYSSEYIHASIKSVLMRDPYDIARSIARSGSVDPHWIITYVRISIVRLECLALGGYDVVNFQKMTVDRDYLYKTAISLGMNCPELSKDLFTLEKINQHHGVEDLKFGNQVKYEFDGYIKRWDL